MSTKLVTFAILTCLTSISPKIIFNRNEFIMEFKSFDEIRDAANSGDLTCGLDGEHLDVDTNKFNGTHIIFSYERVCFLEPNYNYTSPEDVYSKPFICSIKYGDPIRERKKCHLQPTQFEFNDTCAIRYKKACEKLGPCIGQYKEDHHKESKEAAVILNLGDDIVEFPSTAIQHGLGVVIFCDRFQHTWGKNETQYDDDKFVLFRYGEGTCGINKFGIESCSCCEPSLFAVQAKYGHKLNNGPVKKTDKFSK